MNRFRVVFDPFQLVLDVAHDLFPKFRADIYFGAESDKGYGSTDFPEGKVPNITISAEVPYGAAPEILAHEIAHVVAGIKAGHGKKWDDVFTKIQREYVKRLIVHAKKAKLKMVKPSKSKK